VVVDWVLCVLGVGVLWYRVCELAEEKYRMSDRG